MRKLYTESLIGRGDITLEEAEQALQDYQGQLEKVFTEVREATSQPGAAPMSDPQAEFPVAVNTAISSEVVKRIAESQVNIPDNFHVHPRLLPQLQRRATMVEDGTIDWGMGETLAIGSLLLDGTPVRLSGQDSRRGTFGQRHAVLIDRQTGEDYTRSSTSPRSRHATTSTTRSSPSTRSWASSTATRSPAPTRS